MAFEVVGLVDLFRQIKGRSALELEELEHAGRLAQELVTAVGMQEQVPAAVRSASLLRQRAYTLISTDACASDTNHRTSSDECLEDSRVLGCSGAGVYSLLAHD